MLPFIKSNINFIKILTPFNKPVLHLYSGIQLRSFSKKTSDFLLPYLSKNIIAPIATLDLTHININIKLSTFATANDGICYEDKVYKKLVTIFGKSNVVRECDISKLLHSFKPETPKSQLRGIDFVIRAKYNDVWTLFAIQVKIGARIRNTLDVIPFIRTLEILRKFVSQEKRHSMRGLQIVPIWFSSASLEDSAEKLIKSNFIHCFIDSSWSIDIDNCTLFTNFIDKLLIKKTK